MSNATETGKLSEWLQIIPQCKTFYLVMQLEDVSGQVCAAVCLVGDVICSNGIWDSLLSGGSGDAAIAVFTILMANSGC